MLFHNASGLTVFLIWGLQHEDILSLTAQVISVDALVYSFVY